MNCTSCGKTVPDESRYCLYCGKPLPSVTMQPPSRAPLAAKWRSPDFRDFCAVLAHGSEQDPERAARDDEPYFTVLGELNGLSIAQKAAHVEGIVLFLNRWHCRVSRERMPQALQDWIASESEALNSLEHVTLLAPAIRGYHGEFDRLHNSLLDLKRAGIHNMSAASASKVLHLMIPTLFVMWDNKIAAEAGISYGGFQIQMSTFAACIREQFLAANPGEDIETYLQKRTGSRERKTLARLVDEYNWCTVWK